jgi:SnoaL-like protein
LRKPASLAPRITNVLIDLEGDRATVQANLIATFVSRADEPSSPFTPGERYRFEAVRASYGWRLSRVQVRPVWTSGSRA